MHQKQFKMFFHCTINFFFVKFFAMARRFVLNEDFTRDIVQLEVKVIHT
jgi:hypothetical protein